MAIPTSIRRGIVDRLPGQRRAASAAKAADRLCRGVVGDGIARGNGKAGARHRQPCDNRGAMRASAHLAMAIECLDGSRVDTIAYVATQAASGQNLVHPYPLRFGTETHGASHAFLRHSRQQKACPMTIDVVAIQPLVALIAGILILLVPRILNYVVAIYLILIGLIGLWPHIFLHAPH